MTAEEMKSLPPEGQVIVREFLKMVDEMKSLRGAVDRLRCAITDETE